MVNKKNALIMLTFNRPENLEKTFQCVKKQINKNFDFFIINNSKKNKKQIENIFNNLKTKNSFLINNSSGSDTSSFYRFVFAKELQKKEYENFIIIDDDQEFDENFIQHCLDQKENFVFKGWWSFKTKNNYLDRKRLNIDEVGNFSGPGGSVFGKEILDIEEILECPNKYKYFDDIWISYVLNKNNIPIKTLNCNISFMKNHEKKSLYYSPIGEQKQKVWKDLNKK